MHISSIIIHPKYNATGVNENDIALLLLAERIIDVPVVKVNTIKSLPVDDTAVVLGWGRTATEDAASPTLLYGEMTLISLDDCHKMDQMITSSSPVVCAKNGPTGSSACMGDSGGPLVWREHVVGVVSYFLNSPSRPSGCGKVPVVFSSTAMFLNWMRSTMNRM